MSVINQMLADLDSRGLSDTDTSASIAAVQSLGHTRERSRPEMYVLLGSVLIGITTMLIGIATSWYFFFPERGGQIQVFLIETPILCQNLRMGHDLSRLNHDLYSFFSTCPNFD